MLKWLLLPLSWIYCGAMCFRNHLYDANKIKVHNFSKPVVSVGNLTMGGTGKTPIICELLRWSLEQGLKPAVVSRGYKSNIKGVAKVPAGADSSIYGDEPAMVMQKFPHIPFYIGADRVAVVTELLEHEKIDIIFADDAFQHRRLGRNLDIVIIDCTEEIKNYECMPAGRGRENKLGLLRADFIILNKVNLVSPEKKLAVLEFIADLCGKNNTPIIESEYYVRHFLSLDGAKKEELKSNERVLLFSGVGNPQAFTDLMSKNLNVCQHIVYRDHFAYADHDLTKIQKVALDLKVQRIVTTEKDAVKICGLSQSNDNIWVAELVPKLSLRVKSLHEKIRSFCH